MQTIRITITSDNPASVVITARNRENESAKRKAALAALDEMFEPVLSGKQGKKCN